MIGKFFSRVLKEITPADTTPVTLNATGTYIPRYGKQRIYVSGKGGAGTYTSGYSYDNSYTNNPTANPPSPIVAAYYSPAGTNWGQAIFQSRGNPGSPYAYTQQNPPWYGNGAIPGGNGYTYFSNYYNNGDYDFTWAWSTLVPASGGTPTPPTPGFYVPGSSGTYAPTVNTGSGTTVFGVSLPGGYGGAASVVPSTAGTSVPTYSTTPISITVPAGGYVTITFTI